MVIETQIIPTLEFLLRAIDAGELRTSADVEKLRQLQTLIYITEFPPDDLINEFELANLDYRVSDPSRLHA